MEYIIGNVEDKTPGHNYGSSGTFNDWTPLHDAAKYGHLEVYKCIAEHLDDKNPALNDGLTPLHLAVKKGKFEIVKYLIDNIQDKNPADNNGWTPFYEAANTGNFDIFKLISENIENKDPGIIYGIHFTHLDVFEVCKILIEFDTNLETHVGKSAILDLITKKTEQKEAQKEVQKEAQNNDGFFKKLMNSIKNFGCLK